MNDQQKIILNSSPEAASIQTVTGWVSRDGHFWGNDERMARYSGSTHFACDCGAVIQRKSYCEECETKRKTEKIKSMPKQVWDGVSMLYSQTNDRYYQSPDEAISDMEDGQTLECLELIICAPNFASIDEDNFADDLPDEDHGDSSPPDSLVQAINAFNEAMKGIVLSWTPGDYALDISTLEAA